LPQIETETATRRTGGGSAFEFGALANSESNGQLVATGELTDMQARFALAFVENGGNGTQAAKDAGYAPEYREIAFHNLKLPKIRARIQELVQTKLETYGAVIGYGVLIEIAQDITAPPGVRRHCAKDLLELAGFNRDRPADSANPMKSLAEMTRGELEAVVAQGAAVLQAASKIGPVLTARVAPDNAQVTDATALEPIPDKA
jgi:hypothetical protein